MISGFFQTGNAMVKEARLCAKYKISIQSLYDIDLSGIRGSQYGRCPIPRFTEVWGIYHTAYRVSQINRYHIETGLIYFLALAY